MTNHLPILVIDPGHGGSAQADGSSPNNAVGPNGLMEKDLTLEIATRAAQALTGRATVILTRSGDTNLSLSARAEVARQNRAVLFLSIHFNGFSDPQVNGTEVFVARSASQASRDFAQTILRCLLPVTQARDRGVREADMGVLLPERHDPATAACLAEISFLTNPQEAARLGQEAYRQQIATALAEAVIVRLPAPVTAQGMAARPSGAPHYGYPLDAPRIDYNVPGSLFPVAQPTGMTCWAAVATMMVDWRDQMSHTIQAVMDMAGAYYRQKFDNPNVNQQGLPGSEKNAFLASLGMEAEPPMSYTVEGFLAVLQTFGPLWVTTDEDPGANFAIHARIVSGMLGDGTPGGTMLHIVDPDRGRVYDETYRDFASKYEEVAIGDMQAGRALRAQIVHFRRDVPSPMHWGQAGAQSFAARKPARSLGDPVTTAVAIAGLGWQVFTGIATNVGDIHWTMQRMEGAKHPWDQASTYQNRGAWQTKTITSKGEGTTGFGLDEISATFEISFRYNGNSVGYVNIQNVGTNDAPFWGIEVQGTIMPDPNAYEIGGVRPLAAVEVTMNYRFTHSIRDDVIYIQRITLYGDGNWERVSRWAQ